MSTQRLRPKRLKRAEAFTPTYRAWLAEWPLVPEQRVVDTQTGRTHLLVFGPTDAPPLVVLHGAGASALSWELQAESLAAKHRVYALDLPGHYGLSVSTRPMRKMADLMAWLDEVLDALGLPRVDLLGHSFGGQVALCYALHAPVRVHHLVLMAPGALYPLRMSYLLRAMTLALGTRWIRERLLRYLGARVNDHHEPYETRFRRALDMWVVQGDHFGQLEMPFPSTLRDEELRAVSVPTLLIIGEQEVIYDPRNALARAKALFPNVQTVLIPGAGHLLTMSHLDPLTRAIAEYL